MLFLTASAAVAAAKSMMHEKVHAETYQQQNEQRQSVEDVRAVPDPEPHARDSEEGAEHERGGAAKERPPIMIGRSHRPPSFTRFNKSELPITDSELAVIATTPIIGWSRPRAAMGMAATL